MTVSGSSIVAVVLCGGAGSRLGGVDKPLQRWRGRPLVDQILERIEPQVERVCISANRNLDAYRERAPVVMDAPQPRATTGALSERSRQALSHTMGPLAGVLAAARWFAAGLTNRQLEEINLLICPGDSPRVPADLAVQLARATSVAAYVHDGQRPHPLHALVSLAGALTIDGYLESGARSVLGWLETHSAKPVLIADPDAFVNINAPADFRRGTT
ncbi:MAG: molybdenum cofactor guanylyltransferase [Pseudomonadota bacterium]